MTSMKYFCIFVFNNTLRPKEIYILQFIDVRPIKEKSVALSN